MTVEYKCGVHERLDIKLYGMAQQPGCGEETEGRLWEASLNYLSSHRYSDMLGNGEAGTREQFS